MREHYGLGKDLATKNLTRSKIEEKLFGFRDDGREGLLVPTFPRIETKLSMADQEQGVIKDNEDSQFANSILHDLTNQSTKERNSPPPPVFCIDTIQEDET